MPMPILDEITQPDPAGMGEVLNRKNHHTLDAKDHDGSVSHLGQQRKWFYFAYSITASARPSSETGTVMPRAFAVFRLTINSTVVDRCTGRSAGVAPLGNPPGERP